MVGPMAVPPLRLVLEEIWAAAALPLQERRRLASVAVGRALWRPEPAGAFDSGGVETGAADAGTALGQVLEAIRCAVGQTEAMTISEAKRALRLRGDPGRRVASAVGALSKARNWRAHPERVPALLAAVKEVLAQDALAAEATPPSGEISPPASMDADAAVSEPEGEQHGEEDWRGPHWPLRAVKARRPEQHLAAKTSLHPAVLHMSSSQKNFLSSKKRE